MPLSFVVFLTLRSRCTLAAKCLARLTPPVSSDLPSSSCWSFATSLRPRQPAFQLLQPQPQQLSLLPRPVPRLPHARGAHQFHLASVSYSCSPSTSQPALFCQFPTILSVAQKALRSFCQVSFQTVQEAAKFSSTTIHSPPTTPTHLLSRLVPAIWVTTVTST